MSAESAPSEFIKKLPPHLSERVRVIQDGSTSADGDFVLYWMHHAVRSHENPALDTALYLAEQLRLPVLVYQGLGGRHPFNSDRHHTFIMEGAREVQQRLHERRIAHVFYLGRKLSQPSPLSELARRAALVITEDFPAPPFPQWTRMLASRVDTGVWAVDCACIIPMQLIKRSFARAFEFRNRTQKEYDRRLSYTWKDMTVTTRIFRGDCGFDAVDLANADIAELCAQCEIDHTIPPVVHTPGGSSAGYGRWEEFKRRGLKNYDRMRNDATVSFPQGVSRLSAYLHHGHVSPFRIAREAAQDGSKGAAKFLDELLIWRELAHNFCFYHPNPETLDVLPQWALQTLKQHQDDFRRTVYSWERLYRGKTGDALWDAAQKSLLVHGELHNNVRMTWGKALLSWTRDPQAALDVMIDLNHRLALDGNDANSYGGLLWCLGLFDRPFKPNRPVIGSLRPRSTKEHARRLDMAAYTAKVKGPAGTKSLKIAFIGAGISGLFAARSLMDQGHQVQVYEKTDKPGGRTAAISDATFAFDTGAQYFTVRDGRLQRYVRSWHMDGIVEPWQGKIMVAKAGRLSAEKKMTERWVGIPGMDAIAAHLSVGIDIRFNITIISTQKKDDQWQLTDEQQNIHGPYDVVIIAAPPPQTSGLVEPSPTLRTGIAGLEMQPCLAVMVAFEQPLDVPFDAAFIHGSPVRWAARNNSKPRRGPAECWTLHASARWSDANADEDDEQRISWLIDAFFKSIGHRRIDPVYQRSRYWESAAAAHPLNVGCLWDAQLKIGMCGDWCQMSRLEGAALSAMAMAGRILCLNTAIAQTL
jgi:photolyase PhrII